MLWALDAPIDKPIAKLALVAIADYADEKGYCWPSQRTLLTRVRCSERALRDALKHLEDGGYIARKERRRADGTRTADGFQLNNESVNQEAKQQPADFAGSEAINRQILPDQPADFAGHEPVIEPTIDCSLRSQSARAKPTLPDWVPADCWQAYDEMRRRIRKPMTAYAAKLAIAKLEQLRRDGHDPGQVLDQSVLNAWQGLHPLKDERYDRTTSRSPRLPDNPYIAAARHLLAQDGFSDMDGDNPTARTYAGRAQ